MISLPSRLSLLLVALGLVAAGSILLAPSSNAHCTVNVSSCTGHCDVNAGPCSGHCIANAGWCSGTCEVNTGSCQGNCIVNLASCGPPCSGLPCAYQWTCIVQATHVYGGFAGGAAASSNTLAMGTGSGDVAVWDGNTQDCDGDLTLDYDGDMESGIGGAFFGGGSWANEPMCNYGHNVHGPSVSVVDFLVANVAFFVGADDMWGPSMIAPGVCMTDGTITPGLDWADCLSDASALYAGHTPFINSGTTCGYGGDGGYWVILLDLGVQEAGGALALSDPPSFGTITAY